MERLNRTSDDGQNQKSDRQPIIPASKRHFLGNRPTEQGQEHGSERQEAVQFYSPSDAQQLAKDCNTYSKPPTPLKIEAGLQLGKYKISKLLSDKGGFGNVFLAKDIKLDKDVAIKELKPDNNSQIEQENIEKFCKEIEIQAKLQHRNIVSLLDSGRFGNIPFFIMEYMEGGTLRDKILENPNGMSPEKVAKYMNGPVEAVVELDENNLVNRDIKPENILLENKQNYNTKLCDFGLTVKTNDGIAEVNGGAGTEYYQAPEQLEGVGSDDDDDDIINSGSTKSNSTSHDANNTLPPDNTSDSTTINETNISFKCDISSKTDVYSLGVTALELLMGENPQINMKGKRCNQISQWIINWKEEWKKNHGVEWSNGEDKDLKLLYLSKKLHKWIISRHISKPDANKNNYELYLFLSRAVDKDPRKRPTARAFVRGLWQAVGEQPTKKSENDNDVASSQESKADSRNGVLEEFYKKSNRDERGKYYLGLNEMGRKELLFDLILGYCLDLYQSLESHDKQINQEDQGCKEHIEFYKMLGSKRQRNIYRMLEKEQQDEIFEKIMDDRNVYNVDIEGTRGITKLYKILEPEYKGKLFRKIMEYGLYNVYNINEERQEKLAKLYEILEPEHREEFVRNLKDEDVKWIYLSIEEQKGRTKLYEMLDEDQQRELVGKLDDDDIKSLYISIDVKEQENCIKLYNMLEHSKQEKLVNNLKDKDVMKLYMSIKNQKDRTKLYNLLNNDEHSNKKKSLINIIMVKDVKELYMDIKEQNAHIDLYNMLLLYNRNDLIKKCFSDNEVIDLCQDLKKQGYQKEYKRFCKMLSPELQQELSIRMSEDRDFKKGPSSKELKRLRNLENFKRIMGPRGGGVDDTGSEEEHYVGPSGLRSGKDLGLLKRKNPELDDKYTKKEQEEQDTCPPTILQETQEMPDDVKKTFQSIQARINNADLPVTLSKIFKKTLENLFKDVESSYRSIQNEIIAEADEEKFDNLKKMASDMVKDLDRWSSVQKAKESLKQVSEYYTTKGHRFLVSTLADKTFNTAKAAYKQILEGYQQGSDLSDARERFDKACRWLEERPGDLKTVYEEQIEIYNESNYISEWREHVLDHHRMLACIGIESNGDLEMDQAMDNYVNHMDELLGDIQESLCDMGTNSSRANNLTYEFISTKKDFKIYLQIDVWTNGSSRTAEKVL